MTKSGTTHFLSTGVTVQESTRKGNRTGYTGAALSPAWTLDCTKPFIAACGNPTDHTVMAVVNAQRATCLHLGHYADAREAAYVIGMYRKDPINTINYVQSNGQWDHFPEDLYDLPEGLSYEKAMEIAKAEKSERKSKTPKSTAKRVKSAKSVVKMDTRSAKEAIYAIHGEVKGFKILKGIQSAYFSTKERQTVMAKLFNETPIGEIELTYGNRNNNYDLSVYAE